jgi:hypothetical protein
MIEATVVPRHTWVHGEALCPSCRLPIDKRDVDEELREAGTTQPVGAIVTHRRCGATFCGVQWLTLSRISGRRAPTGYCRRTSSGYGRKDSRPNRQPAAS